MFYLSCENYGTYLLTGVLQGRRHRFWTGGGGSLSRKGALGGRGPFLSEPTFYDIKYLLSRFNPRSAGGGAQRAPPCGFSQIAPEVLRISL